MTKIQPRYAIFFLLLTALALRCTYFLSATFDHPIRADAAKYVSIACNLVYQHVYSSAVTPPVEADSLISPGYPLFLTAILLAAKTINGTYFIAIAVQIVLGSASVLLTLRIGRQFLPNWAVWVAASLTAISPHLIIINGYLLTETLFCFCLLLSIYLFLHGITVEKNRFFILAGFTFAIATLIRPATLLYPIVLAGLWLIKAKALRKFLPSYCVVFFLTILPWQIWASTHPSQESLSRNVFILGSYPSLIYKSEALRGLPNREDPQFSAMQKSWALTYEILNQRISENFGKYLYWYALGKPLMLWQWSNEGAQGGPGPFIYPVEHSIYDRPGFHSASLAVLEVLQPLLIILAALLPLFLILSRRHRTELQKKDFGALSIYLLLLYTTAVHTLLAPLPRFSIPYYPLAYLCAAQSAVLARNIYREKLKK